MTDFSEILRKCNIIQYADDTVVYFAHPEKPMIVKILTEELTHIAEYHDNNELITKGS